MKKLFLLFYIALCTLVGFNPNIANAQYSLLTDFTGNGAFTGTSPQYDQNLIAVGGAMYGMTNTGGVNNMGTIFKIMPNGSGFVKLLDFAGPTTGSYPRGSLISDGTFLYGMTNTGGANNMGTIFKIMLNGSGFVKLLDFAAIANGNYPCGSLTYDGAFLYGMTAQGGMNNLGTIFKIMPDGTGFVKLMDFAGTANGSSPIGSLIIKGTFLYGMTYLGGTNNLGTLFKIMPDGTGYVKLLDFNGTNGSKPLGSLISDGTFLYGMTETGGSLSGTVFKILPNGTGYVILYAFGGFANDGYNPRGSLFFDGIYLYGTTYFGGISSQGTVFKILPNGLGYLKLFDFTGVANGLNPYGSLVSDGISLYGMTKKGGVNNKGTIFKILSNGTGFVNLLDFAGAINGNGPNASLVSDGTFLYGMTIVGGVNNLGSLFKLMPDGTGFSKILDFAGAVNGSYPYGALITDGTFLYGMTAQGGTNNLGTVFKIMPDGTGYVKILDFAGTTNGSNPRGSLFSDGTYLYGMTKDGGVNNMGTIFKILPDGTGFVKLLDFTGALNGSNPFGSLISDGTFLYGMTYNGGTDSLGTIFKILPDGTGYVKLFEFTGATNGSYPYGSLVTDGTFLYGMTSSGGVNGQGALFKVMPDGTGYGNILDFIGVVGYSPRGSLYTDGTFLYGMTYFGGKQYLGTFFKIMLDGTGYVKLIDFEGTSNGSTPFGSVISDGTFFYGMTLQGGSAHVGTVFKYCTPVTFSQSLVVCAGHSVTVGNNTYTTSGTYTDSLTSINGCDSIVTTSLTVLTPNTFSQSPTICSGQSLTVGNNTYNISGTYIDSLTSINGCDSTVTTTLTVLPAITNSVTIVPPTCGNNNGSVAVNPTGGAGNFTFLWSNGDTTATVTGLTGSPTDTLIVLITDANGCTLTETVIVNCVTGVNEWSMENQPLIIYPNPNSGQFTISTKEKQSEINIINTLGEIILRSTINQQTSTIDISIQPSGIYFLQLKSANGIERRKVIKQ